MAFRAVVILSVVVKVNERMTGKKGLFTVNFLSKTPGGTNLKRRPLDY